MRCRLGRRCRPALGRISGRRRSGARQRGADHRRLSRRRGRCGGGAGRRARHRRGLRRVRGGLLLCRGQLCCLLGLLRSEPRRGDLLSRYPCPDGDHSHHHDQESEPRVNRTQSPRRRAGRGRFDGSGCLDGPDLLDGLGRPDLDLRGIEDSGSRDRVHQQARLAHVQRRLLLLLRARRRQPLSREPHEVAQVEHPRLFVRRRRPLERGGERRLRGRRGRLARAHVEDQPAALSSPRTGGASHLGACHCGNFGRFTAGSARCVHLRFPPKLDRHFTASVRSMTCRMSPCICVKYQN